ncbi:MAG: Fic family protein [Solirubrobacterales bacterium]
MPVSRPYLMSHSHIDFTVDLRDASPAIWVLLGESKSKSQHVARALLSPKAAHQLLSVYLTKGISATTAIEGNTLSEDEVRRVLEGSSHLPPSRQYLEREVQNVLDAYNLARKELFESPALPFSIERIREYNRLILKDLELEDGVVPGEIRRHSVVVGSYRAAPAEDAEYLLSRLCEWLNGDKFGAPAEAPQLAAPLAIVKAVVAHLYLAWIHPFGDGNGRTARLLELQILLSAGFPVPTCQLLSNHYNQTRSEYYRQLAISSRDRNGLLSFVAYAVQGFVDQLREQLDVIWKQQFQDRWTQFVYQSFGERRSETDNRRLRLVLDLSREFHATGKPVPKRGVRDLSPRLAAAYATKTEKTLSRDLNAIRGLELLHPGQGGWVPADKAIRGLQPPAVDGVLWD